MIDPNRPALSRRFESGAFLATVDSLGQSTQADVAVMMHSLASSQAAVIAGGPTMEDRQRAHMASVAASYRAVEGSGAWYALAGSTAVIPVHGVMLNRFPYMLPFATGYTAIRTAIGAAVEDESVSRIVLDVMTPGGEAAGCMETAAFIREMREKKPIMAMVDSYAYSAGYALASAASHIAVIESGEVGSIGVVAAHVSYEKALEEFGLKITFVYAGDRKIDMTPYKDLSDDAKAAMQERVDALYESFLSTVAAGRGDKFGVDAARKTQAGCFAASKAVEMGMADAIIAPGTAVSYFAGLNKESKMAVAENTPAAPDAAAAARAEERTRFAAVQALPETAGREALANHLLTTTDLSVDQIKAALAASPKAASNANPLEAAMSGTPQPNLTADGGEGAGEKPRENRLIAAARALGHIKE